MHYLVPIAVGFLPALVLGVLAMVATIDAHNVFLPTSTWTHILAIILPVLTYATLFAITRISSPSTLRLTSKASLSSRLRSAVPSRETAITVLFILDTVLITLASSALATPTLTCGLESRWRQLFVAKDEGTIRTIQERLECCGFRSVKDKAWPFPAKGVGVQACVERFGWERPCEGVWTAKERSVLGMIIGVGVGVVMMKIVFFSAVRLRPEWFYGERGQNEYERVSAGRIVDEEGVDEDGSEGGRFLNQPERTVSGDRMANGHGQGERLLNTV
ncbi:hypothetical protein MMC11_001396 [Xylographa trunciseda]|nr:hypothetical protein [Xylographa trunciseda]